jgi:hypothetical protein
VVLAFVVPTTAAAAGAVATLLVARGAADLAGAGLRTIGARVRRRR